MFYVINTQPPTAQSFFAYEDELSAIVAYYNTLAANYSAVKEGTLTAFTVCIQDSSLHIYGGYYETYIKE